MNQHHFYVLLDSASNLESILLFLAEVLNDDDALIIGMKLYNSLFQAMGDFHPHIASSKDHKSLN